MQAIQIFFATLIVLSSIIATQSIELYRITRGVESAQKYYDKANECLEMKPPNGAVYISENKDFECQPLLSKAPGCRPGEWLVLKKHKTLEWIPKCTEKKSCGTNRLAFESINGDCVKLGDPSKCENGEVVRQTLFGYGKCDRLNSEGEFDNLVFDENSDVTEIFSGVSTVKEQKKKVQHASVSFGGWPPGRR